MPLDSGQIIGPVKPGSSQDVSSQVSPAPRRSLNKIAELQSQKPQIELLAAQRAVYWEAKRWLGLQVVCTALVSIAITILGERFENLKPWAALVGLTIFLFDTWATEFKQRKLRQRASRIQELFDCKVLGLHWNSFLVGSKPDAEEIIEYNEKYRKRDPHYADLRRPWYNDEVGELPLCFARLVCQRSNIRWDSKLRRIYATVTLTIGIGGIVAGIAVAILRQHSSTDLVMSAASLAPLLLWGFREFAMQRETAENLDRLMDQLKSSWEQITQTKPSDAQCELQSRDLQDALFEHRRDSPLVFDFIYKLTRRRHEKQMGLTARKMIDDVFSDGSDKIKRETVD